MAIADETTLRFRSGGPPTQHGVMKILFECHTGNISHRVGKEATVGAIREFVKKDGHALEAVDRMIDHLVKKNEVDLQATPLTLGSVLKMNPKAETILGNAAASKLLTRKYRKPFVVPEIKI